MQEGNNTSFVDKIKNLNEPHLPRTDVPKSITNSIGNVREDALKMDRAEGIKKPANEKRGIVSRLLDKVRRRDQEAEKTTEEMLDDEIINRVVNYTIDREIKRTRDWKKITDASYDGLLLISNKDKTLLSSTQLSKAKERIESEAKNRLEDLTNQLRERLVDDIDAASTLDALYKAIGSWYDKKDPQDIGQQPLFIYNQIRKQLRELADADINLDSTVVDDVAGNIERKHFDVKKRQLLRSQQ